MDRWLAGLLLTSASGIMGAVNFLTTILRYRAPGMTMWRLPIFTWNMLVTAVLILMSFAAIAVAFSMLLVDRRFGGHLFDPTHGGGAILCPHLRWVFGHPAADVMILLYFRVLTGIG